MDKLFTLKITKQERDELLLAVEAAAEEYRSVANQVASRYLAKAFENDAVGFDRLAYALKNLANRQEVNEIVAVGFDRLAYALKNRANRREVNEIVARELATGNKINAIKAVRLRRWV